MTIFTVNRDRMKRAEMSSIIHQAYRKIEQSGDLLKESLRATDIHNFRLEVKQLKAFLHLISTAKGGSKVKDLPKKLHQYYKALGFIRDLQLQKSVLQKEWKNQLGPQKRHYLEHIDQLIARAMETAIPLGGGNKPFEAGSIKLLSKLPAQLTVEQANAFVTTSWLPLLEAGDPTQLGDQHLHEIRKALKDLQYTWDYLQKPLRSQGHDVLRFSPERVKSTTSMLGAYLEKVVRLRLLEEDMGEGQRRPFLQKLQVKWTKERTLSRQKVERYLQKLSSAGDPTQLPRYVMP
jgi:CHAD domain-containing protein